MFKKLVLSFLVFTLAGCSHIYGDKGMIKNHDTDYLKAQTIEPLKMPPGYSNTNLKNHYPLPKQAPVSDPSKKRVILTPPELNSSSQ